MFLSNNRSSFHLWQKENLIKHEIVLKYYENNYRLRCIKQMFLIIGEAKETVLDFPKETSKVI